MSTCPNCHKTCRINDAFCPHCGYKLEESDILYHYTSIETLNAILNNVSHIAPEEAKLDSLDYYKFKLRATNWAYFNDPLEFSFLFLKILDFIDKDPEFHDSKDKFINATKCAHSLHGSPYIISLSKSRDNLEMWRSYSKNGTGVAIGLKRDAIYNIINSLNHEKKYRTELEDCRYLDDKLIDSEIRKVYKPVILDFLSWTSMPLVDYYKHLKDFTIFKHPCYITERESRIVTFYHLVHNSCIKFRVSNGINIPYLEVEFPLSAIKEIILGPCADKNLNEDSIRMQLNYMTRLTKSIQIEFSELPYRLV